MHLALYHSKKTVIIPIAILLSLVYIMDSFRFFTSVSHSVAVDFLIVA
jgi:hypothetical protein